MTGAVAEGEEETKTKATRVRRVCVKCRVSHQSCGPERPCKRCAQHGYECIEAPAQKRGRKALSSKANKDRPSKKHKQASNGSDNSQNGNAIMGLNGLSSGAAAYGGGVVKGHAPYHAEPPGVNPAMQQLLNQQQMQHQQAIMNGMPGMNAMMPGLVPGMTGSGSGLVMPNLGPTGSTQSGLKNMMPFMPMMATGSGTGSAGFGMPSSGVPLSATPSAGNGGGSQMSELVKTVQMLVKNQTIMQKTLFDMMVQGNGQSAGPDSGGPSLTREDEKAGFEKNGAGTPSGIMPQSLSRMSWGSLGYGFNQGFDNWSYGRAPMTFSFNNSKDPSALSNPDKISKVDTGQPLPGEATPENKTKTASISEEKKVNGSTTPKSEGKTFSAKDAREKSHSRNQSSKANSSVKPVELVAPPECPIDTSAVTGEKSTRISFSDACTQFKVKITETVRKFMSILTTNKSEAQARKLILMMLENLDENLREDIETAIQGTGNMEELTKLVTAPEFLQPLPSKQIVSFVYTVYTKPTVFPIDIFMLLKEFQNTSRAILEQSGSDPADIPCHMMSEMLANVEM